MPFLIHDTLSITFSAAKVQKKPERTKPYSAFFTFYGFDYKISQKREKEKAPARNLQVLDFQKWTR